MPQPRLEDGVVNLGRANLSLIGEKIGIVMQTGEGEAVGREQQGAGGDYEVFCCWQAPDEIVDPWEGMVPPLGRLVGILNFGCVGGDGLVSTPSY